jgi:hypothetical protein
MLSVSQDNSSFYVDSNSYHMIINKKEFAIKIYSALNTSKVLYSTERIPLKIAKWTGVNFQKYIYEGYSMRFGDIYDRIKASKLISFS